MDVFTRVLFEMRTSDSDALFLAVYVDKKLAFFYYRYLKLRNLIGFWKVGIKVVFTVKNRAFIYGCIYRRTEAYRLSYGLFV